METFRFDAPIFIKPKNSALIFTIALSFLICPILKAQYAAKPEDINSLTKIRLTFFGAGLEREQRIKSSTTIHIGASISSIYLFEPKYLPGGRAPDIPTLEAAIGYSPIFYVGLRTYYNLSERKKASKRTLNNSANYFGFKIDAIPSYISISNKYKTLFAMSVAPHWGMQRSLGKRANFELSLGPALKTNFEVVRVVPFSKLGFSFIL